MPLRRFSSASSSSRALVVGLDARGEIGVERPAADAGAVAVDRGACPAAAMRASISGSPAITPGKFMTSATPIAPWRSTSSRMSSASSVAPERSNGDAGTQLEAETPNVNGSGAAASASATMPGDAEHVGDLVRVGGDGGRPVREHRADELVDPQLRRLQMHVGVDEAGRQRGAVDVDRLARVALAPAGDHAVGDRQRGVDPLARGRAEHAPARDQQVGGLVAARHRDRSCGRLRPGHRGILSVRSGAFGSRSAPVSADDSRHAP